MNANHPNGFTVMKGSKISDHTTSSFDTVVISWVNTRKDIESNGTIVDYILQKDYIFPSPSAASSIFLGRPTNGNDEWKTKDGTKLKDFNK